MDQKAEGTALTDQCLEEENWEEIGVHGAFECGGCSKNLRFEAGTKEAGTYLTRASRVVIQ